MAARLAHTQQVARSIRALASIVLAVALIGCTRVEVRSVPVALPVPARPLLPPVAPAAVQCLAPDTYTTLVNRERAYKTWGLQLEAIIQANNQHAKGAKP